MRQIRTVLVTTDFSATSRLAFAPAMTLAGKFGARIVVAHVEDDYEGNTIRNSAAFDTSAEPGWEARYQFARMRLADLVETEMSGNAEVAREVRRGIPHVEIVRLAEDCGADLIVMATHGRGFLSNAILGSTTERVIRASPCPVLVVRGPAVV